MELKTARRLFHVNSLVAGLQSFKRANRLLFSGDCGMTRLIVEDYPLVVKGPLNFYISEK